LTHAIQKDSTNFCDLCADEKKGSSDDITVNVTIHGQHVHLSYSLCEEHLCKIAKKLQEIKEQESKD